MALALIYIIKSFLLMYVAKNVINTKCKISFYVFWLMLFISLYLPNTFYSSLLSFVILILYIIYSKKRVDMLSLFIPLILCLSSMFSHFLASQFLVALGINHVVFLNIMSLYFLSAVCFLIIYKYKQDSKQKNWFYGPFLYVSLLMILTLLPSILGNPATKEMIYLLMIEVVLLLVCGFILFYLMNKQIKENELISNKLAKEELQRNMYNITQRSMNQISSDKHMMIYTLMKINQMLLANTNGQLKEFVKEELSKYTTYKPITSTGNPLFDYEMTNKINLMISRQIDVKSFMSINEYNPILQEESVVYYLLSCIDQMIGFDVPISEMQLFFNEVNSSYLKVRIVVLYNDNYHYQLTFEKHPLLSKHQQSHNDGCSEYVFLFHTRN